MSVLEEIGAVAIFTIMGLKLRVVPKSHESESDGQKMIYRASRGDFNGERLGLLGRLIAAVREVAEAKQQGHAVREKTLDVEV